MTPIFLREFEGPSTEMVAPDDGFFKFIRYGETIDIFSITGPRHRTNFHTDFKRESTPSLPFKDAGSVQFKNGAFFVSKEAPSIGYEDINLVERAVTIRLLERETGFVHSPQELY